MTSRLHVVNGGRGRDTDAPRDRARTSAGDDTFTIEVHRARTRHFDLRLVRDGSVALWAVSSPIPVLGDRAQTAIRIEGFTLSGAGEASRPDRTRWDDGRMTVRSWNEGEEAVVTLHGALGGGLDGTRTMSLQHVGSVWEDDDHWTITAVEVTP